MKHAHAKKPPRRKATNVSLRVDLVEEAKRLDINLSKELETRLETLVQQEAAARWKRDNQKAIAAYARFVATHGVWNEKGRGW